jgi:integrase
MEPTSTPSKAENRAYFTSKFPGVRWREHPSRRHGVKPDRYFSVRYKLEGKDRQESLGWASEGWTEAKASARLSELKEAQRTGRGHITLKEARAAAQAEREATAAAERRAAKDLICIPDVWAKYLEAQASKSPRSIAAEKSMYTCWILPILGKIPLKRLSPIDLERLKKSMLDKGKSARSIEYNLSLVRQVFNFARSNKIIDIATHIPRVKAPKKDNKRGRFLTHEEADRLLAALREKKFITVHDMALLALHTGMRAGEIFALTWGDIDFGRGILSICDTKGGRNRCAFLTPTVTRMLEAREPGLPGELVFRSNTGGRIGQISQSFILTVNALGLNDGVTDPRKKVVFHTLRHTFASWLVEHGIDLYSVKELMGHGSLAMTERYSHLSEDGLRAAAQVVEQRPTGNGKVLSFNGGAQ